MSTQLVFHNTQFNVISRNNQIWLSSKEIAQALGYAKTNAITKIYNQNTDEFTDGMSQVIESTTSAISEVPNSGISGNLRVKVRIFSLRGAHLIAMFARTPVAKEFRRWVLDVLDREVGEPVIQPAPSHPAEVHAFCDDYSNRTEIIYYQDFKPIFCRVLRSDEIVANPESMREWLAIKGLITITRQELKSMTHEQWLTLVG